MRRRLWLGCLLITFIASIALTLSKAVFASSSAAQSAAPDTPLPRIDCRFGHTATIYTTGLQGPDGLAFNPADGLLYVAEEEAGQVTRINANRSTTAVLTDLTNPEGITFDEAGTLYVVEDQRTGRLIKQTPNGLTTTLADHLVAPEGVTLAADNQTLYVTQSNAQFTDDPRDFAAAITAVANTPPYTLTSLIQTTYTLTRTGTTTFTINAPSYAGITAGHDGHLYVTNEANRGNRTSEGLFFEIASTESVYRLDPTTSALTLFSRNLTASEGLSFGPGGTFPLFVVEENVPGAAETGRLNIITADGSPRRFCTGFGSIEDVALDNQGRLYISEDDCGFVLQLAPQSASARAGWTAVQQLWHSHD